MCVCVEQTGRRRLQLISGTATTAMSGMDTSRHYPITPNERRDLRGKLKMTANSSGTPKGCPGYRSAHPSRRRPLLTLAGVLVARPTTGQTGPIQTTPHFLQERVLVAPLRPCRLPWGSWLGLWVWVRAVRGGRVSGHASCM